MGRAWLFAIALWILAESARAACPGCAYWCEDLESYSLGTSMPSQPNWVFQDEGQTATAQVQSAPWGGKALQMDGNSGGWVSTIYTGPATSALTDYAVEARVRSEALDQRGMIIVRSDGTYPTPGGSGDGICNNCYFFTVRGFSNEWGVVNMVNGVAASFTTQTIPGGVSFAFNDYVMRAEVSGNVVSGYVDGQLVGSFAVAGNPNTTGTVGVGTLSSVSWYDDLQVMPLGCTVTPTPTLTPTPTPLPSWCPACSHWCEDFDTIVAGTAIATQPNWLFQDEGMPGSGTVENSPYSSGNALRIDANGNDNWAGVIYTGPETAGLVDYAVEARVRGEATDLRGMIQLRSDGTFGTPVYDAQGICYNCYVFTVRGFLNDFSIGQYLNGVSSTNSTQPIPGGVSFNYNDFVMRAEVVGGTVTGYVDGQLIGSFTFPGNPHSSGTVGFNTYTSVSWYDEIRVMPLTCGASPTPTPTATVTLTPTPTWTPTYSPSLTWTLTPTNTDTPPPSPTATPTATETASPTGVPSPTITQTYDPAGLLTVTPPPNQVFIYPQPVVRGRHTNLAVQMPGPGDVTVNVWNAAAEIAGNFATRSVAAGTAVIQLETDGFAPGVFFYQVEIRLDNGDTVTLRPQKFLVEP